VSFLRRLREPEPAIGTWITIPSPFIVEVIGSRGFDFVILDMQHGLLASADLPLLLEGASAGGIPALVRVPGLEPATIMRAIDMGAAGVVVPMVNDASEARLAAAACRYPPEGFRSWGPTRVALGHADYQPGSESVQAACIVMIETAAGVSNVNSIANEAGVDGILIGPNDLAITHGMTPDPDSWDDRHATLVREIVGAAAEASIATGVSCGDAQSAESFVRSRFDFVTVSSDAGFVAAAADGALGRLRAVHGRPHDATHAGPDHVT